MVLTSKPAPPATQTDTGTAMKRTEYAAIQPAIDRHGLNRSIEIAEALADLIFALFRGTQRLADKAGGKMEEIAPYLPRSQA